MKVLLAVSLFGLCAAPALAQSPPIDWSKPVVGVDDTQARNLPIIEDEPRPVEVYTREDLLKISPKKNGPSVSEFIRSLTLGPDGKPLATQPPRTDGKCPDARTGQPCAQDLDLPTKVEPAGPEPASLRSFGDSRLVIMDGRRLPRGEQ